MRKSPVGSTLGQPNNSQQFLSSIPYYYRYGVETPHHERRQLIKLKSHGVSKKRINHIPLQEPMDDKVWRSITYPQDLNSVLVSKKYNILIIKQT